MQHETGTFQTIPNYAPPPEKKKKRFTLPVAFRWLQLALISTSRQDPSSDAGRVLLEGVRVEVRNVVEVMEAYQVGGVRGLSADRDTGVYFTRHDFTKSQRGNASTGSFCERVEILANGASRLRGFSAGFR